MEEVKINQNAGEEKATNFAGLTLERTAELMLSGDYRERMTAEWGQCKIRLEKLKKLLEDEKIGKLGFELTCPITLLREQALVMQEYVDILEKRAELEDIRLYEYFK